MTKGWMVVLSGLVMATAVACSSEDDSPANGAGDDDTSGTKLAVTEENGSCDAPLAALNIRPLDEPTDRPEISVKPSDDGFAFLVRAGGVSCDGTDIDARDQGDGSLRVVLRYKRVDGKPQTTFCRCSPDVKGTITGLSAGEYSVQIKRERLNDTEISEEVLTPMPLTVRVGPQ